MIALTAAAGLHFVLTQMYPDNTLTQGLFFGLLFIGCAAATIPIAAYLNHRFAAKSWRTRDPNRLLRQAAEVGVLATLLAYLQLLQTLDLTIALVLIGVLLLMETFFVTRN